MKEAAKDTIIATLAEKVEAQDKEIATLAPLKGQCEALGKIIRELIAALGLDPTKDHQLVDIKEAIKDGIDANLWRGAAVAEGVDDPEDLQRSLEDYRKARNRFGEWNPDDTLDQLVCDEHASARSREQVIDHIVRTVDGVKRGLVNMRMFIQSNDLGLALDTITAILDTIEKSVPTQDLPKGALSPTYVTEEKEQVQ